MSPSQNTQTPVLLQRDGVIATLTFNRPQALNAIDVPMARAFLDAMRELAKDPTLRALVLRGSGRAFMAGGDLATLRGNPVQGAADLLVPLNEALELMTSIDAPVIAQIHGLATGAGLSLMLQADFVLVAQDTRFNLAYINLGASCDAGASWALPRLVGVRRALQIAMLGETLTSADAERLGLVNRVLAADQLEAEVNALAKRLAAGPTLAYGAMKRLMRASFDHDFATQLAMETAAFKSCAQTQDFRTGIEAFYGKTTPAFKGL